MPSIQVSYDALRYSLEQFGLYYTDDEFNRLLPFADPDKTGSFRYVDNIRLIHELTIRMMQLCN